MIALRSQINPHFFFNSLNTIAALIPERPRDAERAVELLAEALRPALTRAQPMTATVESEERIARICAIEFCRQPGVLHRQARDVAESIIGGDLDAGVDGVIQVDVAIPVP